MASCTFFTSIELSVLQNFSCGFSASKQWVFDSEAVFFWLQTYGASVSKIHSFDSEGMLLLYRRYVCFSKTYRELAMIAYVTCLDRLCDLSRSSMWLVSIVYVTCLDRLCDLPRLPIQSLILGQLSYPELVYSLVLCILNRQSKCRIKRNNS